MGNWRELMSDVDIAKEHSESIQSLNENMATHVSYSLSDQINCGADNMREAYRMLFETYDVLSKSLKVDAENILSMAEDFDAFDEIVGVNEHG